MEFLKKTTEVEPKFPLYHYTSIGGLKGILTSGAIWATHIRYLNDTSEFVDGLKLATEIIETRKKASTGDRLKYLDKILGYVIKAVKNPIFKVFVSSFTEEGDLLSLWRGYTEPKRGYSIGYDWRRCTDGSILVAKCIYNDNIKRKCLEDLIDWCEKISDEEMYSELGKNARFFSKKDNRIEDCSAYFAWQLLKLVPIFKHKAFKEENEWRVIVMSVGSPREIKIREGDSLLIPIPVQNRILKCPRS